MSLFKMITSCLAGAALAGASFALLSAPNPANSSLASAAPKVASAHHGGNVDGLDCGAVTLSRTISTPTAGLLTINAQVLVGRDNDSAGTAYPRLSLKVNGKFLDDYAVIPMTSVDSHPLTLTYVKKLKAGTHKVVMTVDACTGADAYVYDRTLWLEWNANYVHTEVPIV